MNRYLVLSILIWASSSFFNARAVMKDFRGGLGFRGLGQCGLAF